MPGSGLAIGPVKGPERLDLAVGVDVPLVVVPLVEGLGLPIVGGSAQHQGATRGMSGGVAWKIFKACSRPDPG